MYRVGCFRLPLIAITLVLGNTTPVTVPQTSAPLEIIDGALPAKRIYFIRHGQALHNVAGAGQCHNEALVDPQLTRIGRKQALVLGRELAKAGIPVDVVLASPMQRTLQTAVLLLRGARWRRHPGPSAVRVLAIEDAREHFSACAADARHSLTWSKQAFPGVDFRGVPSDADPFRPLKEGGFGQREATEALKARVLRLLRNLLTRPEAHVVVVSHGSFIRRVIEAARQLGLARVQLPEGLPRHLVAAPEALAPGYCQVVCFELQLPVLDLTPDLLW